MIWNDYQQKRRKDPREESQRSFFVGKIVRPTAKQETDTLPTDILYH